MLEENVSLKITDITDAVKSIDYAAEQGAFRGWNNIRQILVVRNRLEQFISDAAAGIAANLNITDIADAVKIIDYAAEQGAYKGWNVIQQILAFRDRLELFVSAAAASDAVKKSTENPSISTQEVNSSASTLEEVDLPHRKPRKRRHTI